MKSEIMSYSQFSYAYPTSHLLSSGQVSSGSVTTNSSGGGGGGSTATSCGGTDLCSCQPPPYTSESSRLLSTYTPRLSSTTPAGLSAMYSSSYHEQGYVSLGTPDPSAFYPPLANTYDLAKDGMSAAGGTWGATAPGYPYDPTAVAPMSQYSYGNGYGPMDINGSARRKNATRETTNTLKAWLYEHRKNPYPTKGEKIMLAIITKMTLTQVSTWFANARRRLKKENKMTWSPRNRCGDADDEDDEDGKDDNTPPSVDNSANDQKIICKKEIHDHKDSGHGRDGCDSESEMANDCTSTPLASGSLSNTPKPMMESGHNSIHGQTLATGGQQHTDYQGHHHHHHHHQTSQIPHQANDIYCKSSCTVGESDAPATASLMSSKPKIWSLAQTATSCAAPYGHPRRSESSSPSQDQAEQSLLYGNRPSYQSAFSNAASKTDHLSDPNESDKNSLTSNCDVSSALDCYQNNQAVPWNNITGYYPTNNSLYNNNNHLDNTLTPQDVSKVPCINGGPLQTHIISTQADTPPQTPPSAHHHQPTQQPHQLSSINNNNEDSIGNSNSMMNYTANSSNNGAPGYNTSFHGMKPMFESSSYIGGYKSETDIKPGSLAIR